MENESIAREQAKGFSISRGTLYTLTQQSMTTGIIKYIKVHGAIIYLQLRILASYEAKISIFWTFWPVIQLITDKPTKCNVIEVNQFSTEPC